jgi:hypothetical protein
MYCPCAVHIEAIKDTIWILPGQDQDRERTRGVHPESTRSPHGSVGDCKVKIFTLQWIASGLTKLQAFLMIAGVTNNLMENNSDGHLVHPMESIIQLGPPNVVGYSLFQEKPIQLQSIVAGPPNPKGTNNAARASQSHGILFLVGPANPMAINSGPSQSQQNQ